MDLQNKIIKMMGVDRLLHLSFAGWISSLFNSLGILIVAFAILIIKELIDKYIRKSFFDWIDIAWGMVGASITFIIKMII